MWTRAEREPVARFAQLGKNHAAMDAGPYCGLANDKGQHSDVYHYRGFDLWRHLVANGLAVWRHHHKPRRHYRQQRFRNYPYEGPRDDYKEKLSGATPEQAKARIDALESRLARLEPRRLTETQRADLTARLPIPTGATYLVAVSRDMACADCSGLAADISRAFSGAGGWQISNPMMMGINNTPPHGIAVRCADINNPSPEARIVIEAMRAARIQFDLQPGAYVRPFSGVGPPEPAVEVLLTTRAID
jgi:hypothetical protein